LQQLEEAVKELVVLQSDIATENAAFCEKKSELENRISQKARNISTLRNAAKDIRER